MSYRSDHEHSTAVLSEWIEARDHKAITRHVLGASERSRKAKVPVDSAVCTVLEAYGSGRRKVGAPAAVHPIRVARRLRLMGTHSPVSLVAALGHDLIEDKSMGFAELRGLSVPDLERVHDLMSLLTRGEREPYFDYIKRVANDDAALLIKLVDRLDNTYDLRVSADPGQHDPELVYKELFRRAVLDALDHGPVGDHPIRAPISSSRRLFDLFKSIVLVHFVRHRGPLPPKIEAAVRKLITTGVAEAELTALHVLQFHDYPGLARQVTTELMSYGDRFWRVTSSTVKPVSPLDGLFHTFDARLSKHDDGSLDALQNDLARLLMGALSMAVILTRFNLDPSFKGIAGVDDRGVRSVPPQKG
ncbi:MAG: hypothetical protein HY898_31980 [Deltaproteobacteria bacterium]|nr:hypothetical protein [Deltaproteobacteria bacterium]